MVNSRLMSERAKSGVVVMNIRFQASGLAAIDVGQCRQQTFALREKFTVLEKIIGLNLRLGACIRGDGWWHRKGTRTPL